MPRSRGTRCSSAASSSWLRRRYSISISSPFVSSLFHSGPISNLTLSVDDSAQVLASGLFFGGVDHSGNLSILAVLWYGGSMVMHGASTQRAIPALPHDPPTCWIPPPSFQIELLNDLASPPAPIPRLQTSLSSSSSFSARHEFTSSAFRCPPPPASHDLPSHPLLPQAHSIPFFLSGPPLIRGAKYRSKHRSKRSWMNSLYAGTFLRQGYLGGV
jgi:hypothetical protein